MMKCRQNWSILSFIFNDYSNIYLYQISFFRISILSQGVFLINSNVYFNIYCCFTIIPNVILVIWPVICWLATVAKSCFVFRLFGIVLHSSLSSHRCSQKWGTPQTIVETVVELSIHPGVTPWTHWSDGNTVILRSVVSDFIPMKSIKYIQRHWEFV